MKRIIPVAAFTFFIISCSSAVKQPTNKTVGKEGFIDTGSFQVLIKSEPAPGTRGLVQQRDSAFKLGSKSVVSAAASRMLEICMKKYPEINELNDQKRKDIVSKLKSITAKGYTVAVYYLEDNSALFIYRIDSKGLEKQIDSFFGELKAGKK